MHVIHRWLFPSAWMAFGVYWTLSAFRVKKAKRTGSALARLVNLVAGCFAFALTVSPALQRRYFGWYSVQYNEPRFLAGAFLLLVGLGFAVWARVHLGVYWSGRVQLKEGHQLIRTGPYRWVRHPIYTGILTGFLGTCVAVGEERSLFVFVVLAFAFWGKSRREERLMIQAFGEEYRQYRKEVPAFIPRL